MGTVYSTAATIKPKKGRPTSWLDKLTAKEQATVLADLERWSKEGRPFTVRALCDSLKQNYSVKLRDLTLGGLEAWIRRHYPRA